jgi:hypothetical protein
MSANTASGVAGFGVSYRSLSLIGLPCKFNKQPLIPVPPTSSASVIASFCCSGEGTFVNFADTFSSYDILIMLQNLVRIRHAFRSSWYFLHLL